jgi:hypothetical protein
VQGMVAVVKTSSSREQRGVGDIPDKELGPVTYFYIVSHERSLPNAWHAQENAFLPGPELRGDSFASQNVQNLQLAFENGVGN